MPIDETFFHAEGSGAGGKRRVDHTFNEYTITTNSSSNLVYGLSDAGGIFCSEKSLPKVKQSTDQIFNETTPLIHNDSLGDDLLDDDGDNDGNGNGEGNGDEVLWKGESKCLIRDTSPLALSALLECSLSTVSIIAVGRLGTIQLGAASMASMLANFTGYMIYHGLAAALDTLCMQEFDTGMLHLVAIHFQRMVYLLLIITVPIIVLWSYAEQILPNILSNEETAILAGRYLRIVAWGTPGYALFEAAKRYIQAQGVYSASSYVLSVCAPINAFLNWFLVWYCELGFIGAPIALTITDYLLPSTLFLYVYWGSHDECWNGFTRRAFTNWGPMIRLAVINVLTVEAESLIYGITTLASSYLGPVVLATQTILVTASNIVWQAPYSLSVTTRARVDNLMAFGFGNAAWKVCKVALSVAFGVASAHIVLLSLLRYPIAKIFSTESEVIELVAQVMPLCAAAHFVECMVLSSNGILGGIGKPEDASYLQTSIFAIVALPLQFGLTFGLDWSVWGLWIGALSGFFFILVAQWLYLSQINWARCVREASMDFSVASS
ncbi:hypothetical protein N7509_009284 [Penicillium cosmopolitanum]|uniref:MATE efflux family protein n=1 Tax=Penicillium cosmopolitanum TaxID=1131564 RepID=A0A9W9VP49_9EURO|nr:uncharacterized protein N7509_009284 [Penicillium cosmopolitanum]KAJ5386743.1 hypothetical protein N7509_009284 [Penicillium cosmopolitanum]